MAKGDQTTVLDKLFWYWLSDNLGENKVADHYAKEIINMRIKNWWITARSGRELVFDWDDINHVQWITANHVNNTLLVVQDWHLRKINLASDPITDTDVGDISHSWPVNFVNYWKFTIILTGAGYPRVYDNATLVQLTDAKIPLNTNPSFGMRYAWFTVVNNNLVKNSILISRPITLANQERAYEWVWSGSESITFDTQVLGMTSTLNFLWIFTQTTIDYISRDNLTTTWWVASLFSIPIATGDELINSETIASANEYIFYMTKKRKIKSINYVQWNPTPQVAVISESIDWFLQDLNQDQTGSFAFYDKQENLVKFYVKSKNSIVNDTCIIRDLDNQTRLIDKDKFYAWVASLAENTYAWSNLSYKVIQDEVGFDDEWTPIQRSYLWEITLWNPTQTKQRRGQKIAWKINDNTIISREVSIDEKVILSKDIIWSDIVYLSSLWLWSTPVWDEEIWWWNEEINSLVSFEKVATQGAIRTTWKRMQIRLSGWQRQQQFIVDYAEVTARARMRTKRSDKV